MLVHPILSILLGLARMGGAEEIDYNEPTGVQKRPVFSVVWATFIFWLFLSWFPTRIEELGGFKPSAIENGVCTSVMGKFDVQGNEIVH